MTRLTNFSWTMCFHRRGSNEITVSDYLTDSVIAMAEKIMKVRKDHSEKPIKRSLLGEPEQFVMTQKNKHEKAFRRVGTN